MEDHPPFDEGWSKPVDIVDEELYMGFSLPGSPDAFYGLAKRIQKDATALCMALKSADNSSAIERKRRASEIVAEMSQTLQRFEKSIRAPTAVTASRPDEVSPESGALGLTNGKEAMRPTAVKAVQQVIGKPAGAESIKPGSSGTSGEPTNMDSDGDWSDPVNADGSTSIFMGDIPMAATVDQLQVMIGVEAEIVRYHENRKFGHAKIVLSQLDAVRVLELQLTVSGQKLRVARWQSKAPAHRVPAIATNRRKSEMAVKARQARHHVKSEQARQEQARFVADILLAQAAPNARRLYSQVTSNTAEARMKSMETAVYGVRQLLERLTKHRQ